MDKYQAPKHLIWVCPHCGKTSQNRNRGEGPGSKGWDASCAINAVVCHAEKRGDVYVYYGDRLPEAAPEMDAG